MGESATPIDASGSEALADDVLRQAFAAGARSIHLQPAAGGVLALRLRASSGLVPAPTPALAGRDGAALVDALKRRAGLVVEERRTVQEGTLLLRGPTQDAPSQRLRVATLPTSHGEAVVVDLLESAPTLRLADLGLDPSDRQRLVAALDAPGGLVLAAGPRGQGKRTLLQACVRHLLVDTTRVTYSVPHDGPADLPGLVSVAFDAEQGGSYAGWLRFILRRCDPDVLHVSAAGTHDHEATGVVLEAAASGLLVLAPLSAEDGASAVSRLLDQGHEPYAVAAGVSAVVGCRVLARLCDACKVPGPAPDPEDRRRLAPRLVDEELLLEWEEAFAPRRGGCPACRGTGHTGQVGVYEVLDGVGAWVDAPPRERAYERSRSLREAALLRAAAGHVALVDALRATPPAPGARPSRVG